MKLSRLKILILLFIFLIIFTENLMIITGVLDISTLTHQSFVNYVKLFVHFIASIIMAPWSFLQLEVLFSHLFPLPLPKIVRMVLYASGIAVTVSTLYYALITLFIFIRSRRNQLRKRKK